MWCLQEHFPVESDQRGKLSVSKSLRNTVDKAHLNVTSRTCLSGYRIARGGLVSPRGSVAPHH